MPERGGRIVNRHPHDKPPTENHRLAQAEELDLCNHLTNILLPVYMDLARQL